MTPEQFREMRVKLVSTLNRPWHEIDAILAEYAPPWPLPPNPRSCGCGNYTWSGVAGALTVDGILHSPGKPCEQSGYSA